MTLIDLLNRQRVSYRLADGGQEVAICCLFCVFQGEVQDTRYRLYLNVVNGASFCFNCGWKSRYGVQQTLRRLKLPETDLNFEAPVQKAQVTPVLPPDFQALWKPVDALDKEALAYVRRRGIPDEQIKSKMLGVSFTGEFAYRVLFPIMDRDTLKGLTGRAFLKRETHIKYKHMRGDKHLYNLGDHRRVVISEGVFKALRIEQVVGERGYGSLACLGHSLSQTQLEQLQAHKVRRVVLWPDPDPAGQRGFLGVATKLQEAGLDVAVVWPIEEAADNATLPSLLKSWKTNRRPFDWAMSQRLASR